VRKKEIEFVHLGAQRGMPRHDSAFVTAVATAQPSCFLFFNKPAPRDPILIHLALFSSWLKEVLGPFSDEAQPRFL